jgi:hypothetical protein
METKLNAKERFLKRQADGTRSHVLLPKELSFMVTAAAAEQGMSKDGFMKYALIQMLASLGKDVSRWQ